MKFDSIREKCTQGKFKMVEIRRLKLAHAITTIIPPLTLSKITMKFIAHYFETDCQT